MRTTHLILVTFLVLAAAAPGSVVASHDSDDDGSLVEIVTDSPWVGINVFRGETEGWFLRQRARFGDPPEPADQASDLRSFVDENDQDLVDHANLVIDEYGGEVSNDTYVLEVTIEENDAGDASTFYVVASGDGSEVTSVETTASTNRTVDRSSTLTASEAEALVEDLEEYKDDFVDPGEVPSKGYLTRIGSKYTKVSEIRSGGG